MLTPSGSGPVIKTPRCSTPPKYGLLSVTDLVTNVDPHFMASGFEWEDFLCTPGVVTFIDECPPATGFTKPAQRDTQFCHAEPFIAVGSYDCSTGGRPVNESFEIARQRLLAWEERQIEETLWTGIAANGAVNPSFANGNTTCGIVPEPLSTGPVDAVSAIALLENALGDRVPCEGVIHVPYGFAAYLIDHHLLERVGDEYFTPTGYRVVLGHGYTGSGPGNVPAAAGTTWLYGTGSLIIARSNVIMTPEEVKEGINRVINNITVRAERFYAIGFACALVAVNVNLSCACC